MKPLEPDKRHTTYTENQGYDDSLKRTGNLLIPMLVMLIMPLFYSIFYIFKSVSSIPAGRATSQMQVVIYYITPGIGLALMALLVSFMTLGLVNKNAGSFLQNFYNLPDSVDIKKLAGLRIFGRMPLPPPLSKLLKFPLLKAKDGKIDPEDNWQSIIGGPAKLQIEPGNAVYLERGNQSSRVAGPGPAFIELHERVKVVVNVGPQSKTFDLAAWTRDGIRIDIRAKGEYFLGMPERRPQDENVLIPVDAEAVQKAVETTLKGGKEGHEWIEGAIGKTKGTLTSYIAEKGLEEIFTNGTRLFAKQNMDDLLKNINKKLQESGMCLSYFQIIEANVSQEITDQRLEVLESAHKRYVTMIKGDSRAQHIREQERVHAEMQRDLINTLANGLERIDAADAEKMLKTVYDLLDQDITHSWPSSSTDDKDSEDEDEGDSQQTAETQ